jgi:hypothetical protein
MVILGEDSLVLADVTAVAFRWDTSLESTLMSPTYPLVKLR